jgi:uncharacterized protein DUF6785/uncharacterized protein DUF6784
VAPGPPPWRAPLLGALLIPPSAFFGVYSYIIVQAILWSQQSLKCGPIFVLFLLSLGNLGVRRLRRCLALTQAELVLIYAMLVTATAVGGIGMVQFFVTGLPAPYYFARESNHWSDFFPYIPSVLTPHDPEIIAQFFKGNATLYRLTVLRDWSVPVAVWTGLVFLLFVTMLSVNALLRQRWVEGERLTFPLVFLPLEMTRDDGETAFWRDRRMWAGFLAAGLLESVDYVNYLYPAFPSIQLKALRLDPFLSDRPWNGIGTFAVAFYPFMIGIVFLLSLDVSFSCWFFYLLVKAEMVMATALGWKDPGVGPAIARAPYISEQGAGAFLGVALFALWTARGHLRETVRAALSTARREPGEWLSFRGAWLGVLGGFAGTVLLLNALGLTAWLAALLFGLYVLFLITLTRIVAEAGAGWHFGPSYNPHDLVFDAFGPRAFGPRDLTMLAFTQWIDLDYRDNPMPHQLEAMKMGQVSQAEPHRLLIALLVAAVLGALAAFWANLHVYYEYGAATAKCRPWITSVGQEPFQSLRRWMDDPRPPDGTFLGGMSLGLIVVALLGVARQRFAGWPLHPLGYAIANTNSMDYMWMPFLIAWTLKTVLLRYGGMRLYRAALPFFLGLILGDYVVPTLWAIYGTASGQQMYLAFPH